MELAQLRNERESYDEDELFESGRNPGWEPDSKIIMQLDLGLKITIFNTIFPFVNIVLLLQLYNSNPGSVARSFFTSSILTFFLSIASTIWVCHSTQRIQFSLRPNLPIAALIFFFSGFLAVYFFGMFFRLMFYKDEHAAYLKGQLASAEVWRLNYGQHTYEEVKRIQDSKLNWCIPSSFIFSLSLSYVAIISRKMYLTFSMRSYGLNKLLLIVVALATAAISWVLFDWANEANYVSSTMLLGLKMKRPVVALMSAAFLLVFVLPANVVMAVKKQKKSYLGFIVLYSLLLVGAAIFTINLILLIGQFHQRQETMKPNCNDIAATIHEDRLHSLCPFGGKYLAPGLKCGKPDLTIRWEAGLEKHQIRTLNPACCEMAKYFYIGAHTKMANFAVMLCTLLIVLLLVNYSLWKNSNSLFYIFPKAWETIGAIFLVGVCIAFVIYLFFNPTKRDFEKNNKEMLSYGSPMMFQSEGFPLVPPDMSQKFKGKICHQYRQEIFPFPSANSTKLREKPVLRVVIMALAGYMKIYHPKVTNGATDASSLFFPGCEQLRNQQNMSSFKIVFGPTDSVREALSQAIYCTSESLKDQAKVFYDFSYWGPDELEKNGLTFQEDKKVITNLGKPETASADKCISSNKHFFPAKFGSKTSVKGKLVYMDPETNTESGVHPDIKISVFEVIGKSIESRVESANTVTLEDSIFIVSDIIRLYDFSYTLRLKFEDPHNVFLNKSVDIYISPSESNVIELSAGKIRMTTADGKRCNLDDEICKIKRLSKNGVIKLAFSDFAVRNRGHIGANLLLYKDFSLDGSPIQNQTLIAGAWTSPSLPYGSYLMVILSPSFLPAIKRVDLQKPQADMLSFSLIKSNSNHQMTITSTVLDDTIDFDLMVVLKGDSNRECTISPYNKYCAYAKMVPKSPNTSSNRQQQSKDGVLLKNMAVATYTAYVAPSPSYTQTCKSDLLLLAEGNAQTIADNVPSWDWETVKAAKPLSSVPVLGYIRQHDEVSSTDPNLLAKLRTHLPVENPVETLQESKISRKIKASYPRAILTSSQLTPYLINTDVRFSLKNKGVLDGNRLRNWNLAATIALNSEDEAWEAFNLTKLLNDSVLVGKTAWPEVENRKMDFQGWNISNTANNKEYDQQLANGGKSHITESNSTTPVSSSAPWIHQAKIFRNQTKFANSTSLISQDWWSAQIDPKDKRVLSNMSEISTDFNDTKGYAHFHKIYHGYEGINSNETKQEVVNEDKQTNGNISKRTTLSKKLDTDASINRVRRTTVSCTENRNGTQLVSRSCHTQIHNSTKFSEYDEVQSATEAPMKNETQLESIETYKDSHLVSKLRLSESKVLDQHGILNLTTLSRQQDQDSTKKYIALLKNYKAEIIKDTKLDAVQAMIFDSTRKNNGSEIEKSSKSQNTTTTQGGAFVDETVKFLEKKELENKTVIITTKVESVTHVTPEIELKRISKIARNRDTKRKVRLQSGYSLNETLTKLAGFKHNRTQVAEEATKKTGLSSYVEDSKTFFSEDFQPMTNLSKASSQLLITRKTTSANAKMVDEFTKTESNLTRNLLPVLAAVNQTVIDKLNATAWDKSNTTVQAIKTCHQTNPTCSVEVKGQHQNITADYKSKAAKLAMTNSLNSKGNRVFSQSLQLSYANDTTKAAWEVHSLLDEISSGETHSVIQSTRILDSTIRFPANSTMEAHTKNSNLHFFGNTSHYRLHTSKVKTFSRNYLQSQIKQFSNSTEIEITNTGKVGSDNCVNKVNYSNFLDVLVDGSKITNYSFVNYTETKADSNTFLDIFNLTGTSFTSRFQINANITDKTTNFVSKTSGLSKRIVYSNSTNITGHQYITRWEYTETFELNDTNSLSRESREARKSISYKEGNHQTEVLTTYILEKNKLNETNHFEFVVVTNQIDLSKKDSESGFRKQVSRYEKSFMILPSGQVKVLKEHSVPEDLKKVEPVLPTLPNLFEAGEIPTIIPEDAQNFDMSLFEIKGADLTLVKNQALGLKRNAKSIRSPRQLQADLITRTSHTRTPRAAADARLSRLSRKLKLPTPTFSKTSVDSLYGVDRSRFFLIACFTGYGTPSVLQLNEYTVERPTPSDCEDRLSKSQLKRYRVEMLKRDIEEYLKGHQDYVDQLETIAEDIRYADAHEDLSISDFNVENF